MTDHEAVDDVIALHRQGHERHGTTHAIYFPADAPWDVMEQVMGEVTDLVFSIERTGWDAFVFGRVGDCTLIPDTEAS